MLTLPPCNAEGWLLTAVLQHDLLLPRTPSLSSVWGRVMWRRSRRRSAMWLERAMTPAAPPELPPHSNREGDLNPQPPVPDVIARIGRADRADLSRFPPMWRCQLSAMLSIWAQVLCHVRSSDA